MVVAGTGTDVGKTWVSASVLRTLHARGVRVAARKPAQSYEAGTPVDGTDAGVLGAATGEAPITVCRPWRWYEAAMAPPMAAEVLGRPPFTLADLAAELRWPADSQLGLVESAGGVHSPLAADGDTVDLVTLLRPDLVLLVADAGLGTINSVRLSAAALAPWPTQVVLNRFDPAEELHGRNLEWLRRDGLDVTADIAEVADAVAG